MLFIISLREKLYILPSKSIKNACRTDSLKGRTRCLTLRSPCIVFIELSQNSSELTSGFSLDVLISFCFTKEIP